MEGGCRRGSRASFFSLLVLYEDQNPGFYISEAFAFNAIGMESRLRSVGGGFHAKVNAIHQVLPTPSWKRTRGSIRLTKRNPRAGLGQPRQEHEQPQEAR